MRHPFWFLIADAWCSSKLPISIGRSPYVSWAPAVNNSWVPGARQQPLMFNLISSRTTSYTAASAVRSPSSDARRQRRRRGTNNARRWSNLHWQIGEAIGTARAHTPTTTITNRHKRRNHFDPHLYGSFSCYERNEEVPCCELLCMRFCMRFDNDWRGVVFNVRSTTDNSKFSTFSSWKVGVPVPLEPRKLRLCRRV